MHELLIGFLIVAIVAIQIYVFIITLDKIKIFKNILPGQENFNTVKVFIKESEIESVTLVDIFSNQDKYMKRHEVFVIQDVDERLSDKKEKSLDVNSNENSDMNYLDELDFESSLCIVSKDGETTMISIGDLSKYEALGWILI